MSELIDEWIRKADADYATETRPPKLSKFAPNSEHFCISYWLKNKMP